MKRSVIILLSALAVIMASCSTSERPQAEQVNVFNGTGFHGHTYPGATTPYGLVQLSPDSRKEGWDGCSGYHYSDTSILGFSHTHLSGTGVADLGDFLLTPQLGDGQQLVFSHNDETARPGYYKVVFPAGITAELTAAPHTGVHRYTFSGEGSRKLIIDASHCIGEGSRATEATLEYVPGGEIAGHRYVVGWTSGRDCWMNLTFSVPFSASSMHPGYMIVDFGPEISEVTVYAGLSFNSAEAARANRIAETEGRNFDQVLAITEEDWAASLGTITVEGGPAEQFYTCFYHTLTTPNNIADAGEEPYYSTLSLWDTFRSWNPLQTIINPAFVGDMVKSMLAFYDKTGELPIWPLADRETGCMIGYHSVSVISDAWMRGIRTFDPHKALQAMVESSNKNKGNTSDLYREYGYIPADLKGESVSKTIEMAYDDWCIAIMADNIGEKEIADEYYKRALYYRNLFDPSTGFFRGRRSDGNWVTPFNPIGSTRDYTESIPWQARFFAPHDTKGLTDLMGGREAMLAALDSLFTYDERCEDVNISDITGLIGQYAHGNEPSHHMAYLYNWLGASSRSQKVVRQILNEMYDTTPEGVCGNDDCGQMSAWYVLSSLGIYPACPGSGEFILSAPLFKKATVALGNGKVFTIKADKPQHPYIKKVTLNSKPLDRNWITYDEIMAGGLLEFTLAAKPCSERDDLPAPYSMTTDDIVSVPAIVGNVDLFIDSTSMELSCRTPDAEIYYTLDGSEPTESSVKYSAPFTLDDSAQIKAKAFKTGMQSSATAYAEAVKANFLPPTEVKDVVPGCRYTYHRGEYSETADVLRSKAVESGTMAKPSIMKAPDEDHFGYVFTGYIDIPSDGIWSFSLVSDDGSVLDIDGGRVVNNDGSHAALETYGRVPLKKGLHPYRLVYFEDYEGQGLIWRWKAEGEEKFSAVPKEQLYYR